MGQIHVGLGIALLALVIITTTVEFMKPNGAPKGLRGATIGLLDLQILLGIVAWFTTHAHISFIVHPLLMVIGVVVLHMMTKSNQTRSARAAGWVIGDILLIIGALLYVL